MNSRVFDAVVSSNGFNLNRRSKNVFIPPAERNFFSYYYEGHNINNIGRSRMTVLSNEESLEYISKRQKSTDLANFVVRVCTNGRNSTKKEIKLGIKDIAYIEEVGTKDKIIALKIDDPNGDIAADREKYLRTLARICDTPLLPVKYFEPILPIGTGPSIPVPEALEFIMKFMPELVVMSNVYPNPSPEGLDLITGQRLTK